MIDIIKATNKYEKWLAEHTTVVSQDLDNKHKEMSKGAFKFLRATFYRWVQQWSKICEELTDVPNVLSVGDIHLENYGTWRDIKGRLIWGINDFDEAFTLPYTFDLVRLATSAMLACEEGLIKIEPDIACELVIKGYTDTLEHRDGKPFVLAETNQELNAIIMTSLEDPANFWGKIGKLTEAHPPSKAKEILKEMLSDKDLKPQFLSRQIGLGSLGRARFVALVTWKGSYVAREVKAVVPSAVIWANTIAVENIFYEKIVNHAKRAPDPWLRVKGNWIVRHLAPDAIKINFKSLSEQKQEQVLLYSMGCELANIHLGSGSDAIKKVLKDLQERGSAKWLKQAAEEMTKAMQEDFNNWKDLRS